MVKRLFTLHSNGLVAVTLLLFTTLLSVAQAKSLTLETDRQLVEMGDIITLKVTADFQAGGSSLDLTPLKDQFEVLGTQRSNNIQIINGDFQSSTSWLLQLLPKQAGELMIPPLSVEGILSDPFPIEVTPLNMSNQGAALRPFFLEASVSAESPYLHQQSLYTLRFYHQGRYVDGMIRPPTFDNMLVEAIREQSVYQKQIRGQSYTVYEWLYALYPQTSGKIEIPAPFFNGRIQYRGRLKAVKEFAKPITLDVQAEPTSFAATTSQNWLVAADVQLKQAWTLPANNEVRVGDTLTQTVTLHVDNQIPNQVIDLELAPQSNYKVYPEKPVSQDERHGGGIRTLKTFKRSIIPTAVGTLILPEQVVYWWNENTNQLQQTTLAETRYEVLPALAEENNLANCELPSHDLSVQPGSHNTGSSSYSWIWMALTGLFALLWLATLALWFKQRQALLKAPENRDNSGQSVTVKHTHHDIGQICQLEPPQRYVAIKDWLKKQHNIHSLTALPDKELKALLHRFEAHLYSNQAWTEEQNENLCKALKELSLQQNSQEKASELNGLYQSK